MASAALIELDRVSKTYPGATRPALDDVSLAIAERSFVAIVGGSGSGKTTLLKTINRLIDADGTVRIDGEPVAALDPPTLRRRIGYVFQGIGLFPHLSVAENIGITPRLLGWPDARIAARVDELLDLVGLPRTYAARAPAALSGGERQRVGVARALAARPRIMLMDEPFGALDPVTRDAVASAYRALHERLGLTSVLVTHDIQEAMLLADRIVVMRGGRVVADDTPAALVAGHADPQVSALMAMPRRQAERIAALVSDAERSAHG